VAPWGPEPPARLGAQAQLCSSREDSRACVIEQLCYGCRVNMKDVPSLDSLPPYILAEAQLRSQRPSPEIQEYLLENSDDEAHASGSGAWGPPEQEGNDGQTACDCINKNIFN